MVYFLVFLYVIMGIICSFLSMVYVDINRKLNICYWKDDDRIPFHIASFIIWPIMVFIFGVAYFFCLLGIMSEWVSSKLIEYYREFVDKTN